MINSLKRLYSRIFSKPVEIGLSISYDSDNTVSKKSLVKAEALPVSDYSAKYYIQPESAKNTFELASIIKFEKDKTLYELRCIQTGETVIVNKTAFEMLFVKFKAKK
jgi:hypothetical protein